MINSVYLHYPFCLNKCYYCNFFSVRHIKEKSKEYVDYLLKEIQIYADLMTIQPSTVYCGGGTPSLLEGEELYRLMGNIDVSGVKEFTMEVNPATLTREKLSVFKEVGVDRLSIGMQSFIDKELAFLGRTHNSNDNKNVYTLARDSQFDNISMDLIYGLPGQTKDDVAVSLENIISLSPEHISTYCLSIEKDTPFSYRGIKSGEDEITSQIYRYIMEKLSDAGYEQYEISNFSKRGCMAEHNMNYWQNREYIGFGCSAHSYVGNYRYFNPSDFSNYYSNIDNGTLFPNKEEQDFETKKKDFVIQSLRLTKGLDIERYKKDFHEDFLRSFAKSIEKNRRFLEIENGFLRLNPSGFFVSNEIISDFI